MLEIPSLESIKLQLARLEKSAEFASSARLFAFLQFVVEDTLLNGGVGLKEVVIGNAIYGRTLPYDSRIDSTVRVEARRLRRKLVDFYRGTGIDDPVVITLPTGGYVPSFSLRMVASAFLRIHAKVKRFSGLAKAPRWQSCRFAPFPGRQISIPLLTV